MTHPRIHLVTRSKTGLRLWFDGVSLDRKRFDYLIDGTTLYLTQVEEGGHQVRAQHHQCEWDAYRLGGEKLRKVVDIEPTMANGRLDYIIPDLPRLAPLSPPPGKIIVKSHNRGVPIAGKSLPKVPIAQEPLPEPTVTVAGWTVDKIRVVLGQVRDIEEQTMFKISRDEKTGLAIFIGRVE